MIDDVKYLGGDYAEIELRVMAHEAEARQAAKQEAHDTLQLAKGRRYSPVPPKGNRAARRRRAALNRPKAPRW